MLTGLTGLTGLIGRVVEVPGKWELVEPKRGRIERGERDSDR